MRVLSTVRKHFEINWAFDEYANEKKLMTYIFPEREKIEKAQFILDRSGLVLKACKIPIAINEGTHAMFDLSHLKCISFYIF